MYLPNACMDGYVCILPCIKQKVVPRFFAACSRQCTYCVFVGWNVLHVGRMLNKSLYGGFSKNTHLVPRKLGVEEHLWRPEALGADYVKEERAREARGSGEGKVQR